MNLLIRYLKRTNIKWISLILLLSLDNCSFHKLPIKADQYLQGIKGKILVKSGNFNPDGSINENGAIYSEPLTLKVFELTALSEVTMNEKHIKAIYSEEIASFSADNKGDFFCYLPVGTYSIFVEDLQKGLFAELSDYKNEYYFNPINVDSNKVTMLNLYLYK
ncbi:MAG: hypothetical protein EAZ07_06385 [Cytophagales bacterium]|nr:MAG: hypothetical protein EAZ07_06385 [Cytophagales bacterium]